MAEIPRGLLIENTYECCSCLFGLNVDFWLEIAAEMMGRE